MATRKLLALYYTYCFSLMIAHAEMACVTIKVVDDLGKPVEGATVGIATFERWQPGEGFGQDLYKNTNAKTDKNGLAILTSTSPRNRIAYGINLMDGYYYTRGGDYEFEKAINRKWQPWNPTIELVLKPILNPIPMYAKKTWGLEIPAAGKPIGYDLMVGDWVSPYGKGQKADFVFTLQRQFTTVEESFEATLALTFSNQDDGIQAVTAHPRSGSVLHMPRYAPEAGYESQLLKRTFREKDKPIQVAASEGQNYFFRIRTVKKDEKIISALYGKIRGDIDFDIINSPTAFVVFTYYLNPESNSRNMEFDPKQNLFKNLKGLQRVTAP